MFETGSIRFFFRKKVGQVIVKELCFTDQWLIFILVWKVITGTYEKKNYEKVLKVAAGTQK